MRHIYSHAPHAKAPTRRESPTAGMPTHIWSQSAAKLAHATGYLPSGISLLTGMDDRFLDVQNLFQKKQNLFLSLCRPANRDRISRLNNISKFFRFVAFRSLKIVRPANQTKPSQIEASFLISHHKVKNDSSSISKRCISNDRDKDVPLTLIFFVYALASDKFVCLASKQGFSWVRPTLRDFSIRMNLCVAACCSVS